MSGNCEACGGNGRYNDNHTDCQPCLRCQGTGLSPDQKWPDCLDSNAAHNRRVFRKAAQGHGRAGTADWPGGPYMSMDDAADVHATLVTGPVAVDADKLRRNLMHRINRISTEHGSDDGATRRFLRRIFGKEPSA